MKQLIFKIVIPLTIISFAIFTQWRYASVVDAPDTMFYGFPLPFTCLGWHTSLSLQIFIIEFVIDLLTYFLFWFIVIFCINRFLCKIRTHKIITISLWILCTLAIINGMIFCGNNIYYIKRPFDIEIIKTGYKFFW